MRLHFLFQPAKGGCCDEYRGLLPFNINWLPCKLKLYTINCDRGFHVWQTTCHILCIISLHHPSIHPKPSRPFENQSCYESEWFCGEEVFPKPPGSTVTCKSLLCLWLVGKKKKTPKKLGELNAMMRSLVSLTTSVKCSALFAYTKWLLLWNTMKQIRKHNTTSCLHSPSFLLPFRAKLKQIFAHSDQNNHPRLSLSEETGKSTKAISCTIT